MLLQMQSMLLPCNMKEPEPDSTIANTHMHFWEHKAEGVRSKNTLTPLTNSLEASPGTRSKRGMQQDTLTPLTDL